MDTVEVPNIGLTVEQMFYVLNKKFDRMEAKMSELQSAVDKELADDAAQNELIARLKADLEAAQAAANDAVAGEAEAQEALQAALADAALAVEKLSANDAVEDDVPVENDVPVEDVTE